MTLGDKPLCGHLLDTLLAVDGLDEIVVFCSDEAIVPYLPRGARWLKRSANLDHPETKAAELIEAFTEAVDADIYINAHVTNPFIKAATIENGVAMVKSGKHSSAHVVSPIQNHLWYRGQPFNFTIDNIPRTQDLEPMYEDAGLFVYRKEVWTLGRSRYGSNPYLMVCDKLEALDIDSPEDFKLCEAVYSTWMK
jgi:CMP-N-acetylneuraminic acid synthetase